MTNKYESLPDWSYVIAGLDPAISPAKGIPASERGNDISRSAGMTSVGTRE